MKKPCAKERITRRLKLLEDYLHFFVTAQKAKSLDGWNDIQLSFMLYGYNDEINLVVKITEIITTQPKNQSWMTLMTELNVLARNRLRDELGLPKIKG